jgi:hypothetical protein
MMVFKERFVLILAVILFSNFIYAQTPEKESFEDVEVKSRKAQLVVDRKEIAEFKDKIQQFEIAYVNENESKVNSLKEQLMNDMRREFAQSEAKIEQDRKSIKRGKKEYKLSKKRTKISKEDLKMSEGDKADEEAYKIDQKAENQDKKRLKYFKKDYKKQKKLSKRKEKLIDKLKDYRFKFTVDHRKDNEKHKSYIMDFLELMEDDIDATEDDLKG